MGLTLLSFITSALCLWHCFFPFSREHFGPAHLFRKISCSVALSSLLVVNKYLSELYEAEEKAAENEEDPEYPPFPQQELKLSLRTGSINACIDFAVQALRSLLDWTAALVLPGGLSRRVRKDLRASALRKSHYAFYIRAPRVVRTSLYSEATLYLADWFLACCIEIYLAATQLPRTWPLTKRVQRLLLRCALQGARCWAVWITVSVGNGVGSMAPRSHRGFAMFVCTQLAVIQVNKYANAFIARQTTFLPPPAGPPPVVGPPLPPPADAPLEEPTSSSEAAAQASADVSGSSHLADLLHRDSAGRAAEERPRVSPRQYRGQGRPVIRAGPRLPERRRAAVDPGPPQHIQEPLQPQQGGAPAGPETPEPARDPPRPVVLEERQVEEGHEQIGGDIPRAPDEVPPPPATPPGALERETQPSTS